MEKLMLSSTKTFSRSRCCVCVWVCSSLLVLSGISRAEPVSATLDYTCVFPIIEEQPLTVQINSDMPSQLKVGEPSGEFPLDAVATVSAEAWNGLDFVGSERIAGQVTASSQITAPGLSLPLAIPLSITDTAMPETKASFAVPATGSTPSLTFSTGNIGDVVIHVGDLVMQLAPVDGNGNPTGLGVFESECTLDAGQEGVLHTITLNADNGMPSLYQVGGDLVFGNQTAVSLSGQFSPSAAASSSHFEGDLAVDPASLSLKLISLFNTLSLDANLLMKSSGPFEGELANGTLTAQQQANLQLQNVQLKMFGIPLSSAGMGDCISEQSFLLPMTTPAGDSFDLASGGKLEGQFALPAFQDCGAMTGIINYLLAGPGNSLQLMLTTES